MIYLQGMFHSVIAEYNIRGLEMFGLGTTELILILSIVVLIFGGSKLPALGSGVGKAIRNFKKAADE